MNRGAVTIHHSSFITPRVAVYFLLHFPYLRSQIAPEERYGRRRWPLAITVPCGARTFLPRLAPATTVRPVRGNHIVPTAGLIITRDSEALV
jgi:hypothetical protein